MNISWEIHLDLSSAHECGIPFHKFHATVLILNPGIRSHLDFALLNRIDDPRPAVVMRRTIQPRRLCVRQQHKPMGRMAKQFLVGRALAVQRRQPLLRVWRFDEFLQMLATPSDQLRSQRSPNRRNSIGKLFQRIIFHDIFLFSADAPRFVVLAEVSPWLQNAEGALFALSSCMRRHISFKVCYSRCMSKPDLNLLITLDVLLAEGSVARAARRLRLSPSAMSRALARLRETTGDPLLVRAGRNLVPTPRALELRERVSLLVRDAEAVLRPAEKLHLKKFVRTFTLRTSEGFVENFGPDLIERIGEEAPGVRLRFVQKPDKDSAPLRDGTVDLETGVVEKTTAPELRVQALFRDRYVGVVRKGHPLSKGKITSVRYAGGKHISVSRLGLEKGPLDEVLEPLGIQREILVIVGGFSTALGLARASDLIASVPERHTGNLRGGMQSFPLPISVPEFTVSMLWHPRLDADPAHRWLRGLVRDACVDQFADSSSPEKVAKG